MEYIPYNGMTGNIQDDLEIINMYSYSIEEGIRLAQIYRFVQDAIFAYVMDIRRKQEVSTKEVIQEIYSKNNKFFKEDLPKAFSNGRFISWEETEVLLHNFMVPKIE